jgi:hypothetical protein
LPLKYGFFGRAFSLWNLTRDQGDGNQKDSFRAYFPDFWDILLKDRSKREHRQKLSRCIWPRIIFNVIKGL